MRSIAEEAATNPELVKTAPHSTRISPPSMKSAVSPAARVAMEKVGQAFLPVRFKFCALPNETGQARNPVLRKKAAHFNGAAFDVLLILSAYCVSTLRRPVATGGGAPDGNAAGALASRTMTRHRSFDDLSASRLRNLRGCASGRFRRCWNHRALAFFMKHEVR